MTELRPRHAPWFQRVFAWYASRLVRRQFSAVYIRGGLQPPGEPVIYVVNHSSWWDAIVVFLLTRLEQRVRHDALMSEAGLRRYPFFAKLGAVPLAVERTVSTMRPLLKYVDDWARRVRGALWIFPQGRIAHADQTPLAIEPGAARIAERAAPSVLVPVALRYEFGEAQKPVLWISVGEAARIGGRGEGGGAVERLQTEVDALRTALRVGATSAFRPLYAGTVPIAERWERLKRRLRMV